MTDKPEDQVVMLHGAWRVFLDGEMLTPAWNSKGAAEAGLEVERRRRGQDMGHARDCPRKGA